MAGIAYFQCMWFIFVPLVLVDSIDIYETQQTPAIQSSCDLGFDLNNTREGDYFSCCEGFCKCTNTTADCSGHAGNLTFVPRLPSTVLFLNLSNNKFRKIQRDFFSNATTVKTLSMRNNDIDYIDPDAFVCMYSLEALDVSNCRLSVPSLDIVFQIPTLRCVDISSNGLDSIPNNVKLPHLEEVFLQDNSLETLDLKKFTSSPLLRGVFSGHNSIKEVLSAPLPSLERLKLSSNRITMFLHMCSSDGVPLFPKLETLDLSNNLIETDTFQLSCEGNLQTFILSGNNIRRFGEDMFSDPHFDRLTFLDMSNQRLANTTLQPVEIKQHAFRHGSLQTLSLKNNKIDFSNETHVSSMGFAALPNLTWLDISYNDMADVSEQRFTDLFGSLTKMTNLRMMHSRVDRVSVKTFSRYHDLAFLSLRQNDLTAVPDGAFVNNPNLKVLDLRDNNISALSESTFSETTRRYIQKLLLDGNPIDNQVCDTPWLRDWLKQNITLSDGWGYNCSGHEMSVTPIRVTRLGGQANISQTASIVIIVFVTIFIVILTVVILYYILYIPIQYLWITFWLGQGTVDNQRRPVAHHYYDIYVAYDDEDFSFVRHYLMPELEDKQGLRLCIQDRDFIPGKIIVDNIDECVQRSRLCMMIFSTNFARNPWSQFELAYCLSNELDKGNKLLIVGLGTRDRFTQTMFAASRVSGYIEWDEQYQSLFWLRLQESIENISTNNILADILNSRRQRDAYVYPRQPMPQQKCVLEDVNEISTHKVPDSSPTVSGCCGFFGNFFSKKKTSARQNASTAPEDSPLLDGSSSSNEDEEKQRKSITKKHGTKQTRKSRKKSTQSGNEDAEENLEQGAAGTSMDDDSSLEGTPQQQQAMDDSEEERKERRRRPRKRQAQYDNDGFDREGATAWQSESDEDDRKLQERQRRSRRSPREWEQFSDDESEGNDQRQQRVRQPGGNRERPLRIQRPAPQPRPRREDSDSGVDENQDEDDVDEDRLDDDRYGERFNPGDHNYLRPVNQPSVFVVHVHRQDEENMDLFEDPMVQEEMQEEGELEDQACFIDRSTLAKLEQKQSVPRSEASYRPPRQDADQFVPECIVNLSFDDDTGNSYDEDDDDEDSTPALDLSHLNEPEPTAVNGSNLAEDGVDDSASFQGNVDNGPNPIFSPQWQFFETFSHDGGVLQGENSDVYLTVPQNAIPEAVAEVFQKEPMNSSKTVEHSQESKTAEDLKQTDNTSQGSSVNDDTTLVASCVDSNNDGTSKSEADALSAGAIRIKGAVCTDLISVSRTFDLQDEKIFSPVVEYYAGENCWFQRPVSIYLPHFLPPDHRVEDVRVYTFHRRQTGDISLQALILLEPNSAEEIPSESEYFEAKFAELDDETKSVGAFYFSGESGIVVLTNHFSGVFCSQCGKENDRSLPLDLMMYGTRMMPRIQQSYLKLVIWDKRLHIQDFAKNCPMSSEEEGMILKDSGSMEPLLTERMQGLAFGARLDLPEDEAGVWSHATCRGRIMQPPEIRISLKKLVYCCDEGQQPELVRWTLVRKDDENINNFVCYLTVGYVTVASGGTTMEFISNPEEKILQVKSPELQSGCTCHSLPGAGVSEIPGNGNAMSHGFSSMPDFQGLHHQSFHQAAGRQPEPQNHQGYLYQNDYQDLHPQYHHSRHHNSPADAAFNGNGSPSSMFSRQNRFTSINPLADVRFPPTQGRVIPVHTQGNAAMHNHEYHFPGQVFGEQSFQNSIPPGQHRDVYSGLYPGNAIPCHNPESGVNPGPNYVPGFVAPTHGNGSAAMQQNGSPAFASGPHGVNGNGKPQTVSSAEPAGGDFVSGLNNSFSNSPSVITNTSLKGTESISGGPSRPSFSQNETHNYRPTPTTVAQLPSRHREPRENDPSKVTRTPASDYSTEKSSRRAETLTNTDSTEVSHLDCLLPKHSTDRDGSSKLNAQADLLAVENGSCANGQKDSARNHTQAAFGAGSCSQQADSLDVSNSIRNNAVCSELLENFALPLRCTSAEPSQVLQIQNLTLVRHEYHAPVTNNTDHSTKSDHSTHTIDNSQKTTTTVDKSNRSVDNSKKVTSENIGKFEFDNKTTTNKPTYNKVSTGRRRPLETSEEQHPQNEEYGDPQHDTSNHLWSHENSCGSSCPPQDYHDHDQTG